MEKVSVIRYVFSLSVILLLTVSAAPKVIAADYSFEIDLTGQKESLAGASSTEQYGLSVKYLFDMGAAHSPKYDILAEHEFLTRKSFVRLRYSEEDVSVKRVSSRSKALSSDLRGLEAFLQETPISENDVSMLQDLALDELGTQLVAEDFSLAVIELLPPTPSGLAGIAGLTEADIRQALLEFATQTYLDTSVVAANLNLPLLSTSDLESESVGFDVRLVLGEKYFVDAGYEQIDAPEFTRAYDLSYMPSQVVEVLGISGGELSIDSAIFDVNSASFDFDPDLVFSSSILAPRQQSFDLKQSVWDIGAGLYVTDTSALSVNYSVSETDAEVSTYERDYSKWVAQYKMITRPPNANGVAVLNLSFSRMELEKSQGYSNNVLVDIKYYFDKRFSLGGAVQSVNGSEIDSANRFLFSAEYFVNDKFSVSAGFVFDSNESGDDEIELADGETFTLGLKGRI